MRFGERNTESGQLLQRMVEERICRSSIREIGFLDEDEIRMAFVGQVSELTKSSGTSVK